VGEDRRRGPEQTMSVPAESNETKNLPNDELLKDDDMMMKPGDDDVDDIAVNPVQDVWKLYTSRLFTAWGDRLWSFGFGLFLFEKQSSNLMLLAGYGLALNISSILLLSGIGTWIDQTARLKAAQILLVIQNVCVIIDCVMLALLFTFEADIRQIEWLDFLLVGGVMAAAIVASLASNGSKILVEKDWIVCIAAGDDDRLATLNSNFRTIDLCCQTLAPVLAGVMFSYTSYIVAAIVIGSWNLISLLIEYALLHAIYKQYPQLKHKPKQKDKKENWFLSKLTGSASGWYNYFTHPVRNAGLGLAFLYMTVLGFGNITWGYSLLQCVPEWMLGVLVAVSGFCGVLGTQAFPRLRSKLGIERTGVLGMFILVFCITFCVVSIWLPGSPFDPFNSSLIIPTNATVDYIDMKCSSYVNFTSVGIMLTGIILARFGLWIADLSVSQILQENVQPEIRGVIGGVQNSLNSTMDLVKFVFVLILPHAHTFGILVLLSYTFVSTGALFMVSYAGAKRKLCCQSQYIATSTSETEKQVEKREDNNVTETA